ncbi:MAG: 3'-5' exonuclease [Candidatus Campbellbacteria bacterium]|nr:3'-5' exonuclease [Candidatus Campbellbacteria bacterium]
MIVIDVETTGLDPNRHAVVSLGAVDFENPEHTFYSECRVFEDAEIDEQALIVNGFSKEDILNPSKEEPKVLLLAFREFAKLCKDATLAGQNPGFDLRFLEKAALREHIDWQFARHAIDLHTLCYAHMRMHKKPIPLKNNHSALNLARILEYVGLNNIDVPHHALEDARLTAECISRLIYNKPLFSEFKSLEIPNWVT